MRAQTIELIQRIATDLAVDVVDPETKPYLATALASHTRRQLAANHNIELTHEQVLTALREHWFNSHNTIQEHNYEEG